MIPTEKIENAVARAVDNFRSEWIMSAFVNVLHWCVLLVVAALFMLLVVLAVIYPVMMFVDARREVPGIFTRDIVGWGTAVFAAGVAALAALFPDENVVTAKLAEIEKTLPKQERRAQRKRSIAKLRFTDGWTLANGINMGVLSAPRTTYRLLRDFALLNRWENAASKKAAATLVAEIQRQASPPEFAALAAEEKNRPALGMLLALRLVTPDISGSALELNKYQFYEPSGALERHVPFAAADERPLRDDR